MYKVLFEKYQSNDIDISIIIPSYRTSQLALKDLFCSLINQNIHKDVYVEILIILNGEKNPYLDYILNIVKDIDFYSICICYNSQKGVSEARNTGLEQARGDFICFIDSDDWISESYLMDLYEISKTGKIGLANMLDFEKGKIKSSYFTSMYKKLVQKTPLPNLLSTRSWFSVPVLKILDRKMINNIRFKEGLSNGEDALFMFDVLTFNPKLEFALSATYYRRVCTNGLTLTLKRKGILKRLSHAFKLSFLFICHYIKSGFKQNFLFFITRILAPFKNLYK